MSDLENKFRHLEIFPGILLPLTYDARTEILAAAIEGNDQQIRRTLDTLLADGLYKYLGDLLDVQSDNIEELAASLHEARAKHLGLPAKTSYEDVLAAEKKGGHCLTIGELRRERKSRRSTRAPLRKGDW